MRYLFATFLVQFLFLTSTAQSCLPEGIEFNSQQEIDNFQAQYPGCTEIMGDVMILSGTGIWNLNGLNVIEAVGGNLKIIQNGALSNCSGLNNLQSVGGNLEISLNSALTSLSGLNSLHSIGGNLQVIQNPALTSLASLGNLQLVDGSLDIISNPQLSTLTGLENIDPGPLSDLAIHDNALLSVCGSENICSYLANPNGHVDIYNNAPGCQNPPDIADACGITLSCLPYGDYYLTTQAEIDHFKEDYSNCTGLEGIVKISGNDITNLDGLSDISSIGFYLTIVQNPSLISLAGFNNLTSVSGAVSIGYNPLLNSLAGLENLNTIDGYLSIYNNDALETLTGLNNLTSVGDMLEIMNNPGLSSIAALGNLSSIGNFLWIRHNVALTHLSGLENIDPGSISDLVIAFNSSLSSCEVESICDYLAGSSGNISIHDNANGCNSQEEVEVACATISVEENSAEERIRLIPNPVNNTSSLHSMLFSDEFRISIFDTSGEIVLEKQVSGCESQVDISALARGVYFVKLQNEKMATVVKMIKN